MASTLLFSIAALIVIIVGIVLLFKFAENAVKWLLLILGIMVIASVVFGVNLFTDVQDLKENFPKAQKLLLLKEGNTLLTGFEGKLFSSDDVLSYVSKEQLAAFQQHYSVRDIKGIKTNYFKVIIFDISSFEQLDAIAIDDKTVHATEILDHIRAPDTLARAVAQVIRQDDLQNTQETRTFLTKSFHAKGISSDADMRAFFFAQLFTAATKNDPLFLISEFKNDNIIVYPETITFKLAKIIPANVLKDALNKGNA